MLAKSLLIYSNESRVFLASSRLFGLFLSLLYSDSVFLSSAALSRVVTVVAVV